MDINIDFINSCFDDLREQKSLEGKQAQQKINNIQSYIDAKQQLLAQTMFEINMAKTSKATAIKEYYRLHDTGLTVLHQKDRIRLLWSEFSDKHKEPTEEQAFLITYITHRCFGEDTRAKLIAIIDVDMSLKYSFVYKVNDMKLEIHIPNPAMITKDNYDEAMYSLYRDEGCVSTQLIATLNFEELKQAIRAIVEKGVTNDHDDN